MTPEKPAIRVLLVDDSLVVREGVKALIDAYRSSDIVVVGEAATASDALHLCETLSPDVVLLDIRLPDASGIDVCATIHNRKLNTRVIMLTSHSSDSLIFNAITAGAEGYLMKEIDPPGLIQAIIDVANGGTVIGGSLTDNLVNLVRTSNSKEEEKLLRSLSPQETRIMVLMAEGNLNKEIGTLLGLSENTVKNYIGNIFEKLRVKNRSGATALYTRVTSSLRNRPERP